MDLLVRHFKWVMLLSGLLTLTMVEAAISKITFITLVIIYGRQYLNGIGVAIAVDSVIVILFALYLVTSPRADRAVST